MSECMLDIMDDARRTALENGRRPRRWEVNDAARVRILSEDHPYNFTRYVEPQNENFLPPIFGIPVARLIDPTDDPRWNLIVDENPSNIAP